MLLILFSVKLHQRVVFSSTFQAKVSKDEIAPIDSLHLPYNKESLAL